MRTREPWDRKRRAEPSSERGSGVKGFCRLPGPFAEWRNGHRRGGVGVLSPVAPLIIRYCWYQQVHSQDVQWNCLNQLLHGYYMTH